MIVENCIQISYTIRIKLVLDNYGLIYIHSDITATI